MNNFLKFFIKKISNIEFKLFFFNEIFQSVYFFINYIPGSFGVLCRGFFIKIFLKKSKGLPLLQTNIAIQYPENMTIGSNFGCNSNCYINAIGGINFGNNVLIGPNVIISSGKHPIDGKEKTIFERPTELKTIIIGNDVWIGGNSSILPGIKIANGTVVGANSVITADTEPYTVYAGNPARKIRSR